MIRVKRAYILPLLLPVQFLLVRLLAQFPQTVERYYSNGFYVWTSKASRWLLGWIPFSIGDVLYGVLILAILRWIWISRHWRSRWRKNLLTIASALSIFYFSFHVLWAMNYHRVKLYEKFQLDQDYSDIDLLRLTKILIARSNAAQVEITRNPDMKVTVPYTRETIYRINLDGYRNLAQQHPDFAYQNLSVKGSLISTPLAYMGFAGYLNPFTGEAQVNDLMPLFNFPTTAAHEMAHQIGFASESEANFVGFMASIANDDPYVRYSGYTYALKYCMRNWQYRDPYTFEKLRKRIHPGILANYKESEDFWMQYQSALESGFKIFYDNFLKFNAQQDGLEGYSRFVDLLVNYQKTHPV